LEGFITFVTWLEHCNPISFVPPEMVHFAPWECTRTVLVAYWEKWHWMRACYLRAVWQCYEPMGRR